MTATAHNFTIETRSLRALMHVAPKQAVRVYLKGIHVDTTRGCLVATDGAILLAVQYLDALQRPGVPAFQIPRDTVAAALKAVGRRHGHVALTVEFPESADPRVTLTVAGASFSGKSEGAYPNWVRVVPDCAGGTPGMYDPQLLARLGDALQELTGSTTQQGFRLLQNGAGGAALCTWDPVWCAANETPQHIGVIMPMCHDTPASDVLVAAARVRGRTGSAS